MCVYQFRHLGTAVNYRERNYSEFVCCVNTHRKAMQIHRKSLDLFLFLIDFVVAKLQSEMARQRHKRSIFLSQC
jgi:hypothetical protein